MFKDKHCGGQSIRSWHDGSDATYGKSVWKGLSKCEKMCSDHAECQGFIHRKSDDICGFWKKDMKEPKNMENKKNMDCHMKIG